MHIKYLPCRKVLLGCLHKQAQSLSPSHSHTALVCVMCSVYVCTAFVCLNKANVNKAHVEHQQQRRQQRRQQHQTFWGQGQRQQQQQRQQQSAMLKDVTCKHTLSHTHTQSYSLHTLPTLSLPLPHTKARATRDFWAKGNLKFIEKSKQMSIL